MEDILKQISELLVIQKDAEKRVDALKIELQESMAKEKLDNVKADGVTAYFTNWHRTILCAMKDIEANGLQDEYNRAIVSGLVKDISGTSLTVKLTK